MKKLKLFSLALMALFSTGVWAADITVTPTFGTNAKTLPSGLFTISHSSTKGDSKISSGAIAANSKDDIITINFKTSKSDMYIKSVTFNSLSNGTLSTSDGTISSNTFTVSGNKSDVNVVLTSNSNAKGTVKITNVIVNTGENDVETITFDSFDGTAKTFGFTSSAGASSSLTSISSNNSNSISDHILSWSNGRTLVFEALGKIKYAAFVLNDGKVATGFTTDAGTYVNDYSWTGDVETLTFTNGTGGGKYVRNFYLIIEPAAKHSVTYDLNGGTGTTPTQEDVAESVKFTLHDGITGITAPTGMDFAGWSDGTTTYDGGAEYTMGSSDVAFTAQWTAHVEKYAITEASLTGGSVEADVDVAPAGATITLTATPATDYLFEAWDVYKTGEEGTKVTVTDNQFTMPAYAVTVSATFVDDTRTKILYITATDEAGTKANDKLYAALKNDYNIHIVGPASTETLTDYALAILHESLNGGGDYNKTAVAAAKTATIPVLNTKSYFYNDGRWAWGTPNAGKSVKGCSLNSTTYQYVSYHPIFADVVDKDGFVEIIDEAEAKAMQPVGSFTTGLEGYTIATTPNADSNNGCAIHEIPAGNTTRGANTGKYLMISVSNSALGKLNANGQKLFQNAVAYLLSNNAWTPEFVPTALDNAEDEVKAVKVLRDGQIFIEKNGHVYNVLGACVK